MESSIRRSTILGLVVALGAMAPAPSVSADEFGRGDPVLRIPGMPPVPLPPGTHVFGPNGDAGPNVPGAKDLSSKDGLRRSDSDIYRRFGAESPGDELRRIQGFGAKGGAGGGAKPRQANDGRAPPAKKVLTPEEKQAEIRKALAPKPPLAEIRRKTLDDLLTKLAAAKDQDEARGVAAVIVAVWMRSSSDTANLLMKRANVAIVAGDYPLALGVLDKVVELEPAWAEAWNKRASVRFMAGDLNGSMADVGHVLKLEPNHFLALNGLAMILERTGFEKRALQVYRRELAIYPHQPEIEKMIEKLSHELEGQGI